MTDCKTAFDALYKAFGFSPGGTDFEKDGKFFSTVDFNVVRVYDPNITVDEARKRVASAQKSFDLLREDYNSKMKNEKLHARHSTFVLTNVV